MSGPKTPTQKDFLAYIETTSLALGWYAFVIAYCRVISSSIYIEKYSREAMISADIFQHNNAQDSEN